MHNLSLLQLQHYAQDSTDLEDLNAHVVAAENRKNHHDQQNVALFFSLVVGLPVFAFVLVWISVRGAFPYIRSHINDSDSFPSVAALYWIGLTFTFFVIVMDVTALVKNAAFGKRDSLQLYKFIFILLITIFEILGLFLCFVLALIPLFSHAKDPKYKFIFQDYYATLCCGMPFKRIGRKEARVWLLLSSLITPIMALSAHAGFVIGGWVSYEDRSIAIFLLYLFIFVFLYWSLQYFYKFSTSVVNHIIRKGHNYSDKLHCFKKLLHERVHYVTESGSDTQDAVIIDNNEDEYEENGEGSNHHEDNITHHEDELSSNYQKTKQVGFDTVAMFFMLFLLIFFIWRIVLLLPWSCTPSALIN